MACPRPFACILGLALASACGESEPDPAMGTGSASPTDADDGAVEPGSSDDGGPAGTSSSGAGDEAASTSEADASTDDSAGDSAGDSSGGDGSESGVVDEDLDMQPGDFTCLLQWSQVRRFRITNLLGRLDQALEVAENPAGGVYPVGTVIQLIPTEAMVKRAAGFSPATNDWEFFFLGVSAAGTTIEARGTTDVVNGFGGNCFGCHSQAEPQWDLVCETGHGCDPIPIGPDQIEQIQQGDPRCP